jgi:hypothetical protein
MCQFVTQHPADISVQPEAIICICTQPQLDGLAVVDIQSQQSRVLVWCELCEEAYLQLVLLHDE